MVPWLCSCQYDGQRQEYCNPGLIHDATALHCRRRRPVPRRDLHCVLSKCYCREWNMVPKSLRSGIQSLSKWKFASLLLCQLSGTSAKNVRAHVTGVADICQSQQMLQQPWWWTRIQLTILQKKSKELHKRLRIWYRVSDIVTKYKNGQDVEPKPNCRATDKYGSLADVNSVTALQRIDVDLYRYASRLVIAPLIKLFLFLNTRKNTQFHLTSVTTALQTM